MPELTSGYDTLILTAVLSYLLGTLPSGILIARALGLGDLRQIGSGNIGATNVLRTGNKGAALATLILDAAKGAIAVLAARWFAGEDAAQLAGLSAFLGHLYPVWLNFNGGKGVATFLGVLLAMAWPVGLMACGTWLLVAVVGRMSSLAALIAAATSALWLLLFNEGRMLILVGLLTIFVYARHSANISRIRKGTEPRIGAK